MRKKYRQNLFRAQKEEMHINYLKMPSHMTLRDGEIQKLTQIFNEEIRLKRWGFKVYHESMFTIILEVIKNYSMIYVYCLKIII